MGDYKVTVRGFTPGAAGIAMPDATREFVVYEVGSPAEAGRAACRSAVGAGVEGAYVVACVPWAGGKVKAVSLF
jgi:hypothetical protein